MNLIPFFSNSQISRWNEHTVLEAAERPILNYIHSFIHIQTLIEEQSSYNISDKNILLAAIDKIAGEIFVILKDLESPMNTSQLYKWSFQTNRWIEEHTSKSECIKLGYRRCLNYTNLRLSNLNSGYTMNMGLNDHNPITNIYNKNYFRIDYIDGTTPKTFSFSSEDPNHTKGCFLIPAIDLRTSLQKCARGG